MDYSTHISHCGLTMLSPVDPLDFLTMGFTVQCVGHKEEYRNTKRNGDEALINKFKQEEYEFAVQSRKPPAGGFGSHHCLHLEHRSHYQGFC